MLRTKKLIVGSLLTAAVLVPAAASAAKKPPQDPPPSESAVHGCKSNFLLSKTRPAPPSEGQMNNWGQVTDQCTVAGHRRAFLFGRRNGGWRNGAWHVFVARGAVWVRGRGEEQPVVRVFAQC